MITKIFVSCLLAMATVNSIAGNITYKANDGSMRTTYITDTIEEFYGKDQRAMLAAQL